jgi:programmed cell death 8 (apoptosis-inducing factor)
LFFIYFLRIYTISALFFKKKNSIVLHGKETIQAINQEALEQIESAESGVKLLTGVTVEDLNIAEQSITLNTGKTLKYGKVLLATGGVPKTLPALQGAGEGKVTTFRSVEDFKKLHSLVKSADKKIVVVGGGFLGSELAVAVSHYGKCVYFLCELVPPTLRRNKSLTLLFTKL